MRDYRTALIDGSGFAKAAYNPMLPEQAPHRFLLRIFKVNAEYPGVKITVVWDPRDNKSERLKRFLDYKKRRIGKSSFLKDENYLLMLREIYRILPALGVSQAWADGWEADDVLGTLARNARERPVLVLTRDKDMLQLVREDVHVLLRRGSAERIYTPRRIEREWGFPAEVITDWKALAGDTGDDVQGIPGLGEKAATAILRSRPSAVRSILNKADPLTPEDLPGDLGIGKRFANLLRKAAADPERLRLMRWLVSLHEVRPTFRRAKRDLRRAKRLMLRLELNKLTARLREFE